MSKLLPVGTRVEIVGPDCIHSGFIKIGEVRVISKVSETGYPYAIQITTGPVWFPESSIKEIKE